MNRSLVRHNVFLMGNSYGSLNLIFTLTAIQITAFFSTSSAFCPSHANLRHPQDDERFDMKAFRTLISPLS